MNDEKLILFDLGGVVIEIDFSKVWKSWVTDHFTNELGTDIPITLGSMHAQAAQEFADKLARELGPASENNDSFHKFERGEISEQDFYELTAQRSGLRLSAEQWRKGWNEVFVGELTGTQALIKSVKSRVRLMALSNINSPHFEVTTSRFAHLLTDFEKIFYSHQMKVRKPDMQSFHIILQHCNLPPSKILFFDDMPSNVDGARAAGLKAEVFTNAGSAAKQIQKFLIEK